MFFRLAERVVKEWVSDTVVLLILVAFPPPLIFRPPFAHTTTHTHYSSTLSSKPLVVAPFSLRNPWGSCKCGRGRVRIVPLVALYTHDHDILYTCVWYDMTPWMQRRGRWCCAVGSSMIMFRKILIQSWCFWFLVKSIIFWLVWWSYLATLSIFYSNRIIYFNLNNFIY